MPNQQRLSIASPIATKEISTRVDALAWHELMVDKFHKPEYSHTHKHIVHLIVNQKKSQCTPPKSNTIKIVDINEY